MAIYLPNFRDCKTISSVNRRKTIQLLCLSSGIAISTVTLHRLLQKQKAEAIPLPTILKLIEVSLLGITLVNEAWDLGERIVGFFRARNDTEDTKKGNVLIETYHPSKPLEPEFQVTESIKMPPYKEQNFQLPEIRIRQTPGERILKIQSRLNSVETSLRAGSFCCDSAGNKRCPLSLHLSTGMDCLCPGQGIGTVCE